MQAEEARFRVQLKELEQQNSGLPTAHHIVPSWPKVNQSLMFELNFKLLAG
jgi:hypothetical protein